jgi:hypothetical protein
MPHLIHCGEEEGGDLSLPSRETAVIETAVELPSTRCRGEKKMLNSEGSIDRNNFSFP